MKHQRFCCLGSVKYYWFIAMWIEEKCYIMRIIHISYILQCHLMMHQRFCCLGSVKYYWSIAMWNEEKCYIMRIQIISQMYILVTFLPNKAITVCGLRGHRILLHLLVFWQNFTFTFSLPTLFSKQHINQLGVKLEIDLLILIIKRWRMNQIFGFLILNNISLHMICIDNNYTNS